MAKQKRRIFSKQFKADAVRLVTSGAKTIAEVTKQYELSANSLRRWVESAESDAGSASPDALTSAERNELMELRRRVKRVEMERDILKKATAFFARENA